MGAETLCGMNSTIILDRDTAMRLGETEEEEADNSHVQVWTDGSVSGSQCGIGVVIFDKHSIEVASVSARVNG